MTREKTLRLQRLVRHLLLVIVLIVGCWWIGKFALESYHVNGIHWMTLLSSLITIAFGGLLVGIFDDMLDSVFWYKECEE